MHVSDVDLVSAEGVVSSSTSEAWCFPSYNRVG